MEALLLIFGELVFALLAPFVVLVIECVGSLLGMTISFGVSKSAGSVIAGRLARRVALALIVLATLMLSALWVVNSFYFDSAVRHVFGVVEKRSGIETACQEIDGSFFAGRVELQNCTARRPSHSTSSFDLSIEQLTLDIRVLSLLGTADIEVAEVVGLDGWVSKDRSLVGEPNNAEKIEKPRRAFVIEQLNISEINIELSGVNPDGNPFKLPIEIEKLESQPLRSRLALFDILFRSNAAGSIAGAPFQISTSTVEDGRITAWRAQAIPVASLGAVTGGPLAWFSSGSVDVFVDDEWQRGRSLSLDMDWRLSFKDVEVRPPAGTGPLGRMAAEPLTRYVNGLKGEFPLEFQMVLNENQFEYKSSLAAAGLWSAMGESVNSVFGSFGVDLESASKTADTIKEGAKSVLDRLRRPKGDGSD